MGKRWVPAREYARTPHSSDVAPSLWWFALDRDQMPMPESQFVIATYIQKYKRGRKPPKDFEDDLLMRLRDLITSSPHRKKYWAIPNYARAHRIRPFTFMKRLRELENIAKDLLWYRVPPDRVDVVLTKEQTAEIRQRVLSGADIRVVAREFGIPPFRVGQLCRDEKATSAAERERLTAEHDADRSAESESPRIEDDLDQPF